MFFFEYCKAFKNSFFIEHVWWLLLSLTLILVMHTSRFLWFLLTCPLLVSVETNNRNKNLRPVCLIARRFKKYYYCPPHSPEYWYFLFKICEITLKIVAFKEIVIKEKFNKEKKSYQRENYKNIKYKISMNLLHQNDAVMTSYDAIIMSLSRQ